MTNKKFKIDVKTLLEILLVSSKLGITSFGGPIAHLGYFHEEYVRKRKWLDEQLYAELVALCQFLPGPASSQVGIGIGVIRGGLLGGILSFVGFTSPSVILLILFGYMLKSFDIAQTGWIHGMKIVAVAVVAHALVGMAQKLTPDNKRKLVAIIALVVNLFWQTALTQISIILLSAITGIFLYKQSENHLNSELKFPITRRLGLICLVLFFGFIIILPILRGMTSMQWIAIFDSFYRSGSLVFGGGHVVLPLVEREFVPTGWLNKEEFLAGYGAAQAVPGPLFTFAAYIGTVMNGLKGGLLATFSIFLPAFLLIIGTLPFWNSIRRHPSVVGALMGVNAAVVGILIAAFYQPIWTSSIFTSKDFAFASILFSMLAYWKLPPWVVVLTGAIGGWLLKLLFIN